MKYKLLILAIICSCSIFLRVDRSINEMHKPGALFSMEIFYKKYRTVPMYLNINDIFYVHNFSIKLVKMHISRN
jgi:hypothetical protein